MKEVSDRVVTIFLFIAIFSTVGSIATIFYHVGGDPSMLTGFASVNGSATVTLTVASTTVITILNGSVDFGSGSLVLSPDGTPINTSECGSAPSGSQYGEFDDPCGIRVRNDGNSELNISINGSTAAQWLDSGSTYDWQNGTGEVNSCGMDGVNMTTTQTPFSNAMTQVCANLSWTNDADEIVIDILINLSTNLGNATYQDSLVRIDADSHVAT
jgi:hypothetical protein